MTTTLQEYSFISDADALEISVLRCTPAGRPRAIIQLVHGMAAVSYTHLDVYKRQDLYRYASRESCQEKL